jgi:hypothetical protein
MKNLIPLTAVVFIYMLVTSSSCSVQDEKTAMRSSSKAPPKVAKAEAKAAAAQ